RPRWWLPISSTCSPRPTAALSSSPARSRNTRRITDEIALRVLRQVYAPRPALIPPARRGHLLPKDGHEIGHAGFNAASSSWLRFEYEDCSVLLVISRG